jgi:predicted transposase/invertase (TIGR01784 family)
MKRDSIFYKLFAQSPRSLFELLPAPPKEAKAYRFDSVSVKEPSFAIDGVFLPPSHKPGIVYFAEVQFQRDQFLYERLFGESLLYFYRNRKRFTDWHAVVIYPRRSTEQEDTAPYDCLLESRHVTRIYLNELGPIEDLPLGLALMVLTIQTKKKAPEVARKLLDRAQREEIPSEARRDIIGMVGTIISYRFNNLSRKEVETMLAKSFTETRFYRDVKEEGREEAREEALKEAQTTQKEFILRMFAEKIPMETIARITGWTLEDLQSLEKEAKKTKTKKAKTTKAKP